MNSVVDIKDNFISSTFNNIKKVAMVQMLTVVIIQLLGRDIKSSQLAHDENGKQQQQLNPNYSGFNPSQESAGEVESDNLSADYHQTDSLIPQLAISKCRIDSRTKLRFATRYLPSIRCIYSQQTECRNVPCWYRVREHNLV